MPKEPTKEELLAIAEKALAAPLSDYHKANIEMSAQHIAEGTGAKGEDWNLSLIKMMLMTSYRVREIKAGQ